LLSYHFGAITTEGKLFTWGRCDAKALGHGHEVDALEKPKIVEHLNDKFVFAIGFGGWQSSVLAIDLNE
jgi:alpha-tubulin suppressor-like RCC1 family protein